MNNDGSDIVRMSFEGGDLFGGIVIVNSQLEVIGAANNPVLTCNKTTSADRYICKLKGLDNCLVNYEYNVMQALGIHTCVSYDQM